jgi:hypothetical protein
MYTQSILHVNTLNTNRGRAAWGGLGTKRNNGQNSNANTGNGQNRSGQNRSASVEDRKVTHSHYLGSDS